MKFNEKAETYEANAKVQKISSDRLFDKVIQNSQSDVKSILEIGCGTGYLSKKLTKAFPSAKLDALDISNAMLNESGLDKLEQVQCIEADATTYKPHKKYDLIVSNLSFQWFENQIDLIKSYLQALSPNGRILINTMIEGSYSKFITCFKNLTIPYPGLNYLSRDEFTKELSDTASLNEYLIKENFKNTRTFLKKLHAIGAYSGKRLSINELRQIIKAHDAMFENDVQIEYKILEIMIKRENHA